MVRWALASAVLALGACTIDSGKLDAIRCNGTCDGPDLECVDGYCVARDCNDFRECGDGFQFVCEEQHCRAIPCETDSNCAGSFECTDGWCVTEECGPIEDEDSDGFVGVACGGPDCDDDDPDVNPGAAEGGDGESDPTCRDGVDNDCDGREDTSDDDCGPCTADADCEDGSPCTADTCSRGDCLSAPVDGVECDDGDACTTGDTCDLVICRGDPISCDDGLDCTADECAEGGCTNVPVGGTCLVDGACFDEGAPSPDEPCLACDPTVATNAFSPIAEGDPCDDGDDCTDGETCVAGACGGGAVTTCDDGLDCTTDACDGAGGCTIEVAAGRCAVDGACWNDGDPDPVNVCQVCDAATDPLAWTVDAGADPDDGLACTVDACVAGVETHTPDDGACGGGQVCAPCAGTANGCANAPSALALSCDATAAQGDPGASCTLDVSGVVGADACLSCETLLGMTTLVREDFSGCPDLAARGWTVVGSPTCPTDAGLPPSPGVGADALEAEQSTFSLTRRFDATGLDRVRLCFDSADVGAAADDLLEVLVDSDGTFDVVHTVAGGPAASADALWVTTCLDLDALDPVAAGNPDLGVTIQLTANGAGDNLYLDGVVLEGWAAGAVVAAPLVSTDFAACALGGWTASGDPTSCPSLGALDALGASEASWSLSRTIDASAVCEDLTVGFALAGQGALAADTSTLAFDSGAGSVTAWGSLGQPGAAGVYRALTVNLSHRDPAVRFDPTVDVSFALDAATVGATLAVDDLAVSGASCAPGTGVVTAAAPSRVVQGTYDVAVTSSARTRAYVACTWSGRPAPVARAPIDFLP